MARLQAPSGGHRSCPNPSSSPPGRSARPPSRPPLPLLQQGKPALDAALAGAQAVEDDPDGPLGRLRRPGQRRRHRLSSTPASWTARRSPAAAWPAWRTSATSPPWPAASWRRRRTSCSSARGRSCSPCSRASRWRRCTRRRASRSGRRRRPQGAAKPRERQRRRRSAVRTATTPSRCWPWTRRARSAASAPRRAWRYKLPGRVGDSPLIGAGLYVDDTAGAAGGTGVGEEIIRIGGSLFIVEEMRAGKSPQEACELAVQAGQRRGRAARRPPGPGRVPGAGPEGPRRRGLHRADELPVRRRPRRARCELLKAREIGPCGPVTEGSGLSNYFFNSRSFFKSPRGTVNLRSDVSMS